MKYFKQLTSILTGLIFLLGANLALAGTYALHLHLDRSENKNARFQIESIKKHGKCLTDGVSLGNSIALKVKHKDKQKHKLRVAGNTDSISSCAALGIFDFKVNIIDDKTLKKLGTVSVNNLCFDDSFESSSCNGYSVTIKTDGKVKVEHPQISNDGGLIVLSIKK